MRVAYIKVNYTEYALEVLGSSKQYYYAPQHAWSNDSVTINIYEDEQCTRPVSGCFLKARFELQYYTDTEVDKGVEVLEPMAPIDAVIECFKAAKDLRGHLAITKPVMKAVNEASPHICLLVEGGQEMIHRHLNDIENEAKYQGIPTIMYRSQSHIAVGLSVVRVGSIEGPRERLHGYEFSTVIIDEPFVMNNPQSNAEPTLQQFMITKLR